jgi:hypothetical protein
MSSRYRKAPTKLSTQGSLPYICRNKLRLLVDADARGIRNVRGQQAGRVPYRVLSEAVAQSKRARDERDARHVALAYVISPPAGFVSAGLADAALECTALARALRLAEWVGPGRQLTSSGVLRPAVAAEACQVLGIELPGARLRSALDVDELMRDWTVALDADLIAFNGRHVYATPALTASADPERVLSAWVTAAARGVGLLGEDMPGEGMIGEDMLGERVPGEGTLGESCVGCLIVLHELYTAEGPVDLEALAGAVAAATEPGATELGAADGEPCPDCGRVHDPTVLPSLADLIDDGPDDLGLYDLDDDPDELDSWEHAENTVASLAAFGAVSAPDGAALLDAVAAADGVAVPDAAVAPEGAVQLTPLGSMLAAAVFEGCAPAPDADVATVVSAISDVPPAVARTLARPWLDARSADAAVGELLAHAESVNGEKRVAALAFATDVGPEAAQTWREWAGRPGFGAYARQWLASQGEPAAEDPADEAWLAVDALSVMLEVLPVMLPPTLLPALLRQYTGHDMDEALASMRDSGHPAAADVVARLTGRATPMPSLRGPIRGARTRARGGASASGTIYQLKISLRGVSKPPVWRRVAVPADITLAEMHEVILRAMGWHGGHLHVFSIGWEEYGTPSPDLGHADDAAVGLSQVLSAPGDKIRYTYDFGDDWEHDIQLEEVMREEPGRTYPSCLAGKGACPPEDCGGAPGYAELKEILADPGNEQYQDMLDWLGLDSGEAFDPKAFPIDVVNARLLAM